MLSVRDYLDSTFYPGASRNWDDELFRRCVLRRISRDSTILDLGAGAGVVAAMDFRQTGRRVCGIDLDPRVMSNRFLDDAQIADAAAIPYADRTFDVVVADNVMEHLDDPQRVYREVWRVLKPGGRFLFKTPNRRHYMPLIARLSPYWFHRFVNRLRGRDPDDTFRTLYRANRPPAIRRFAAEAGFVVDAIDHVEGRPEYLRVFSLTYLAGITYERIVNSTRRFADFRVLLIADLVKPGGGADEPSGGSGCA